MCQPCMLKIQLFVCGLGIRNASFTWSGKHALHVLWHWIWKMKQQLLPPPPPPPPLLKRAWSFLMDKGRNSRLGMNNADGQEYFACIITVLRLQRRWVEGAFPCSLSLTQLFFSWRFFRDTAWTGEPCSYFNSRKKKGMKREIMCWNFFPLRAGISRYPQNHLKQYRRMWFWLP